MPVVVAACWIMNMTLNPEEMIQKLEGAGLGYHVQDINNVEKFGKFPQLSTVLSLNNI